MLPRERGLEQHLGARRPMISDEIDDLLIELAASLPPPQRAAFEAAARAALAAAGCSGCGAAYRVLAPLQRGYWDPPDGDDLRREGARHFRPSKLADGPPLADDSARGRASTRSRWLRGWRGWVIGPPAASSPTAQGWRYIAWAWRDARRTTPRLRAR